MPFRRESHVTRAGSNECFEADGIGSLRFTLGRNTTQEDVDFVLQELPAVVARARSV